MRHERNKENGKIDFVIGIRLKITQNFFSFEPSMSWRVCVSLSLCFIVQSKMIWRDEILLNLIKSWINIWFLDFGRISFFYRAISGKVKDTRNEAVD